MPSPPPLEPNCFYHVFNRGINGENLFREERNYEHFLRLYAQYIEPVAQTFAYCLMRNHFHIAIRVKEIAPTTVGLGLRKLPPASQGFANLFNAYSKAINKAYGRTGGLFENPYRRILIHSDSYFARLIAYIHRNPYKHGFVEDFRDWKWSSYQAMLTESHTKVQREQVLAWFHGREGYIETHRDLQLLPALTEQDFL